VVSQAGLSTKLVRFWPDDSSAASASGNGSRAVGIEEIERTLVDSVRRQLISEVPVGMYLSGGVDSSLITTLAQPFRAPGQLHTFSVGFEEPGFDESDYARRVAERVSATHHAVIVTESEYVNELEATVRQCDEPLNHAHTVQLRLLSRHAKPFVTVVLTGEGADELFGGYPRLQIPLLARYLRFMPNPLSKALTGLAGQWGLRRVLKLVEAGGNEAQATIHNARFVPWQDFEFLCPDVTAFPHREGIYDEIGRGGHDILSRVLEFDRRTYLPALLMRLDKVSMASAVECRVPFLDNEVIDASLATPSHLKIQIGRANKIALKKIAAGRLPSDLVYRRKSGFGTPLAKWFRNDRGLGTYLDALSAPSARVRQHVDGARVSRLIAAHRSGDGDHSELLWGLLNLELWSGQMLAANTRDPGRTPGDVWTEEIDHLRHVKIAGAVGALSVHTGSAVLTS
jgi:asparagine synthase (glutamine-hydrolysing)